MPAVTASRESTVFNFLTRDGAISATFPAKLTAPQYEKLLESIRDHSDSAVELRERIAALASEWEIEATVEDGIA